MRSRTLPRALAVALAGCSFPAIDGEVVTHGRHITLHADPALPICPSTLDQADTFVDLAVAYLDATPAPDVTYYLHDGNPSGCRLVGDDPLACTDYDTIHTATWIHFHEIVHTIARDWGRPPAFLLEGLAEGLGTSYPLILPQDRRTAELPLESTAFFAGDAGLNYRTAGDFVVYLLHRFGVAAFRRLSRELPYLADELTTRTAFRDITGVELATVIADWRTAPTDRHDLPLDRLACAAAVLPPAAPDTWQHDEPAECHTSQSAHGATLEQHTDHVVDIGADGLFVLAVAGAGQDAYTALSDCTLTDPGLVTGNTSNIPSFELGLLTAGPHAIDAGSAHIHTSLAPDPSPPSWSLTGLGAARATCDGAPAFSAPTTPWSVSFSSLPSSWPTGASGPELWLRLDLGPDDTELLPAFVPELAGSQLCSGPCDALACTTMTLTSYAPIPGQPTYVDLHSITTSRFVFAELRSLHSTTASRGPATTARSFVPR